MPPDRRSADTRNKILEIAENEFATQGYHGAHLQRIAEQVGVQKTALYYYFPSKAALYAAVLVRMLEAFDATIRESLERAVGHVERLESLLDALNSLLAERRNYAYILFRIFVDQKDMPLEGVEPLVGKVVGQLMTFFKDGREAGAFANLSARHMFQSAFGAVVFHYATGEVGAGVLGVDDIFTHSAVAWRKREARRFVLRALLADPDAVLAED